MGEKITATMATATTVAKSVFDFVLDNEWLALIFIVGIVSTVGFSLIRKAKFFARG